MGVFSVAVSGFADGFNLEFHGAGGVASQKAFCL